MQQEQQVSAEKPKHVVCQHFSCSRVKRVVRLHVEEGSFLTPPERVIPPKRVTPSTSGPHLHVLSRSEKGERLEIFARALLEILSQHINIP